MSLYAVIRPVVLDLPATTQISYLILVFADNSVVACLIDLRAYNDSFIVASQVPFVSTVSDCISIAFDVAFSMISVSCSSPKE